MKELSLLYLCFSLCFFSCSNDDSNNLTNDMTVGNTDTNGFIFNNEKYPTSFVNKTIFDGNYQLTFASEDFTTENYSGSINFAGVLFQSKDGEIIPGTYTFLLDTDPAFDSTKNFFDAESGVGLKFNNGDADLSSGYYEKISSGTITISKEETTYTVTYSLVFPEGTFEGNYTGTIINSEEIKTPLSLIGKWELIELVEDGVAEDLKCPKNDTLEFSENGQATLTIYLQGKNDGSGDIVRECVENPTPDTVNWTRDDTNITFDYGGGDTEIAEITELTDSRLVLKYTYQEEGNTFVDTEVYKRAGE